MNTRITNIAFLFVSTLWLTIATQSVVEETDLEKLFDEWMESFNKEYKSSEEKEKRMKIWIENNGACSCCGIWMSVQPICSLLNQL